MASIVKEAIKIAESSLELSDDDEQVLNSIFLYNRYIKANKQRLEQQYPNMIQAYKSILHETKEFILNTVKRSDTLAICGATTYLLWNGFLSKNKQFIYDGEVDASVVDSVGYLGLDVVNGVGCCRHLAPFLQDILTENNICSYLINNHEYCTCNYLNVGIIRHTEDGHSRNDIGMFYEQSNTTISNHVCNIIPYHESYLVYDPTNIQIYRLHGVSGRQIYGNGTIVIEPHSLLMYEGMSNAQMNTYIQSLATSKKIKNVDILVEQVRYGVEQMREHSVQCNQLYQQLEPSIEKVYQYKLKKQIKERQQKKRLTSTD